ncbi:MAG TPA: carbohydrate-binding family 9-like protein [Polyangiaceae bacterium]
MTLRFSMPLLLCCLALSPACSKDKYATGRQNAQAYVLEQPPAIEQKLDVVIDDKMELLGFKLEPKGTLKVGQKVKLILYWRPKAKITPGYILLTHLLDGSGERLSNLDNNGPLRKGEKYRPAYPPHAWEPGKVYVDELSFEIPKKLKTDRMQIVAGMVKGNSKNRLPITAGKKDSENRAFVTSVSVTLPAEKPKAKKTPSLALEKLAPGVKLKIDGKLDEEAWTTAQVIGPFVDAKTGEPNKTFPVNASARMLWNDEALFVGFDVQDKDIVGGFKKTDKDPQLWTKDSVELIVDPGPDGNNVDYYDIQIGPQNLVFDSQYDKYGEPKTEPDGPFGHQEWASNLKSAVVLDGTLDKSDDEDKGYVVEAMIPWKSFNKAKTAPPAPGDSWRLNLYALQANDGVAWSPILGEGTFHRASRFGKVRFVLKDAAPPPAGSASGAPSVAGPPDPSGAGGTRGAAPAAASAKPATPKPPGSAK